MDIGIIALSKSKATISLLTVGIDDGLGSCGSLVDCRCPGGFVTLRNDGHTTLLSVNLSVLLSFFFKKVSTVSGLPSAALCTLGTGLANAAIFALVFPAVR